MKRESWGDKPYSPDMDFSQCKQAEPTDKYGTLEEITNAFYYYDKILDTPADHTFDSIDLLQTIQKGIPATDAKILGIKKPELKGWEKPIAKPQELANMVHHYLDWLRATAKRKWDNRPLNPKRHMLDACKKGLYVTKVTHLHYDEDPESR